MSTFDQTARKFGTAPVFFTAISTILGAIMFLRFGYAVGSVGLLGTMAIILIGHAVTIPTAMAIAEIATNQKVEGGGEYYIISRSFGLVIGSTIGIALYLSQAISVAFYVMAFAEAFTPLFAWLQTQFVFPPWADWLMAQKQTVSIPALFLLTAIVLTKGADLGVKTLYIVVATLAVSMVAFFVGQTEYAQTAGFDFFATAANPADPAVVIDVERVGFFTVFAIIFPAFTGMTAGVGLSGDLRDPGRSIPMGTLSATLAGMVVYFFIAFKLSASASPSDLADTSRLVMSDIAWQGWLLIPLGLAAATLSSALGSIMVAPRTLQAIARDHIFPAPSINQWLGRGRGRSDEPFNSSLITILIALVFIMAGAIDSVAEIISMFFMVTYGSLCLISFLNHFAADPSYRPRFRSKWFISLFGAVACFGLIFFMNTVYGLLAVVLITVLYFVISYYNQDKQSIAVIFQGVIFQFSRQLQVFLQKADKEQPNSWRPSAVAISDRTFERLGLFDLLRWLSQKYGFGTYIHQVDGYLSRQTNTEAQGIKERLIKLAEATRSNIYVDTLISPSYTSTIAQIIQLPGVSGADNNLLLFEYSKYHPDSLDKIIDNFKLIKSVDFDTVILGSSERGYGLRQQIHIWITSADYDNANLMILLAYILLGHRDWQRGEIKIFAVYPDSTCQDERIRLYSLIEAGQLPISPNNIEVISRQSTQDVRETIAARSQDADLVILGFREELLRKAEREMFAGYDGIGNVLFVNSHQRKEIK